MLSSGYVSLLFLFYLFIEIYILFIYVWIYFFIFYLTTILKLAISFTCVIKTFSSLLVHTSYIGRSLRVLIFFIRSIRDIDLYRAYLGIYVSSLYFRSFKFERVRLHRTKYFEEMDNEILLVYILINVYGRYLYSTKIP